MEPTENWGGAPGWGRHSGELRRGGVPEKYTLPEQNRDQVAAVGTVSHLGGEGYGGVGFVGI